MNKETIKSYKEFWRLLTINVEANLKFAQLVAQGDPIHQYYFFGEYSESILSWILFKVYDKPGTQSNEREILGQYYEFVAEPFKNNIPQWYQLLSYKGLNNQKLHSWLCRNGAQWFSKIKVKDEQRTNNETELPEHFKISTLIHMDEPHERLSDEELRERGKLKKAWEELNDKDQLSLRLLIINKVHWSNAWEQLSVYIEPKNGKAVMKDWSAKTKQDALARLKKRALQHLIDKFNK